MFECLSPYIQSVIPADLAGQTGLASLLEPDTRYVFIDCANFAYQKSICVKTKDIVHSLNVVAKTLTCFNYRPIIVLSKDLATKISHGKLRLHAQTITSIVDGADDYIVAYCAIVYHGLILTNDHYNWSWLASHHFKQLIQSISIRYINPRVFHFPTPRIITINPQSTHIILPVQYTLSTGKPQRSPPTLTLPLVIG